MSIVNISPHLNKSQGTPEEVAAAGRQRLEKAAEQFEAVFLQQILKQMRKAGDVLAADNSMHSRQMDTLRDFHDEALAQSLASRRQTGIADMLVQQLSGKEIPPRPSLSSQSATQPMQHNLPASATAHIVSSVLEPITDTWQRSIDNLSRVGRRGVTSFKMLVDRVIEHESRGQAAVISPKGARGLMQLMPNTAREMAAELGLEYNEQRLVTDVDYNKRLGSAYLNKLLQRYDGEQALTIAAYNAGPARVDEWLKRNGDPRRGEISVKAWIELIPFEETRNYTNKVLANMSGPPAPLMRIDSYLSRHTRQQLETASYVQVGLWLAAVWDTRVLAEPSRREDAVSHPDAAKFKPVTDSVALVSGVAYIPDGSIAASRSAAFAPSLRIVRKEIES